MSVAPIGLGHIPIPPVPPLTPGLEASPEKSQFSFAELLNNAIVEINDSKVKSDELTMAFLTGELKDYHTLAIALQESSLTMQMAIEVRNKVIEAYQEVTRMQV